MMISITNTSITTGKRFKTTCLLATFLLLTLVPATQAFTPNNNNNNNHKFIKSITAISSQQLKKKQLDIARIATTTTMLHARKIADNEIPMKKMTSERRKKLGIADDEDEYDLGMALDNNTDPFITKVIAGSFILVIIGLLVAGVVIPATTDYGEGVCNPLLTGGRC